MTVQPSESTGPVGQGVPDRELLPVASGRQTWALLRELLRPRLGQAVVAFGLLIAGTVAGLFVPRLLGHIVDLVTEHRGAGSITAPVILLALAALGEGVLASAGVAQLAKVGEGTLAQLRERFVARVLRLPLEQVERAGSGDLTSRVTNDVSVIADAARSALPELTRALLTIGLTMVGMAFLDWRFLLAALIAVPVQLHTVRWYARRAVPLYAAQRIAVGAQQHHLLSTINGAATVRAFRRGDDHVERVGARSRQAVDLLLRGIALQTRFYSRLHIAEFLGLGTVLLTGFLLVRGEAVSVGSATAAALYFHNLFGPINVALGLVDDAQAAGAGLSRLAGVAGAAGSPSALDAPDAPDAPDAADAPDAEDRSIPPEAPHLNVPADSSIKTTDLEHEYLPGRPVLRGVGIEVDPLERVALVGASGAGKTTLAKLIAGVHRPTSGSIRLGGIDLAEPGPEAAGRTVVLITQEVHVFAGTLADDLRLARPGATDGELRAALARVDALDWVQRLPDGLATEVGEGGHGLTVAQAQQLAFARLVLADPPIVILDEATAEAGSAGARLLEKVAAAALEGRTALIVAHRLTQAAQADRIIVMADGEIVETGTHDELVAAGGRYATLWAAWSDQRPS